LAAKHPVAKNWTPLKETAAMEDEFHGFLRVGEKKICLAELASKSWLNDWHNLRLGEKSAPTADPLAPPPKIFWGEPAGLKASIKKALKRILEKYGAKPYGKSSVLVGELIFTVAADYFGGKGYKNWDQKKVEAWKEAVLKMIAKVFGERTVAIIYHEDESAPHFHVYVMPLVNHKSRISWNPNGRKARYTDGQFKLSSRAFFTRANLIHWQDEYGLAIKHLGLLRGRRGSEATHRKMRDTQRDLDIALNRNKKREVTLKRLQHTANIAIGDNEYDRNDLRTLRRDLELREKLLRSEKVKIEKLQKKTANRKRRLESVNSHLRMRAAKFRKIPVVRVAEKLKFLPDRDGVYQGEFTEVAETKFQYRVFIDGEKFRVESFRRITQKAGFEWTKMGSGNGAIDFMKIFMPSKPVSHVCNRLAELFPESKEGLVLELLEGSNPELWKGLSQQRSAQAPAVDLDPDIKPDSKSSPESP
jgi:hypothetical protein